jgi:CspA family cold shock protein
MQTGTVKWFNNAKGYGFILSNEGGGDIFAHYSSIDMDGYKTLKAGQSVCFETENGPKGLHAIKITSDQLNENKDKPSAIVEAALAESRTMTEA